MMIYKLAGEAFPDIKIPELTAFYEELEKWSDIFEGRPKWRRVKRSGGLVRGSERMVNMLNTGKILCDEETARQKAVSSCIREFADKGIPAFVDKAGREWSPEAYINMDIRTTVSNTANAAQDAVCDRYGVDLIEVSSHMGARPKCAPYQGKIFSRSNQSGIAHDGNGREIRYEPLSGTSYGQPDGLFGINCRHQKYPFVDGVNFQTYFPYDEAENAKRYKEFQTQRAMERDIRKKKRECMMLEETGDAEALKAARTDLRQSKKAYNAYSDEHGLRTREDRLRVERSSGKGAADQSSAKPVLPGGSGGHAVEVSVSGSDNGGNGKLYRDTGLTNGGGNGIINTKQTKLTDSNAVSNPMDPERYYKMKEHLERNGCPVIAAHGEDERFLIAFGAEAISDEYGIMHLGDVPSASAFFEEIIHNTQTKKYGVADYDSDGIERVAREVAANRKLLKHGKAYGFTDEDFDEISRNLKIWEEQFEKRVGVSYDETNIKRDV